MAYSLKSSSNFPFGRLFWAVFFAFLNVLNQKQDQKIAAFGSSYRRAHSNVGAADGSGRDWTIF
ncbi:hypothetical protein [Pseudomonas gregormendelii]